MRGVGDTSIHMTSGVGGAIRRSSGIRRPCRTRMRIISKPRWRTNSVMYSGCGMHPWGPDSLWLARVKHRHVHGRTRSAGWRSGPTRSARTCSTRGCSGRPRTVPGDLKGGVKDLVDEALADLPGRLGRVERTAGGGIGASAAHCRRVAAGDRARAAWRGGASVQGDTGIGCRKGQHHVPAV